VVLVLVQLLLTLDVGEGSGTGLRGSARRLLLPLGPALVEHGAHGLTVFVGHFGLTPGLAKGVAMTQAKPVVFKDQNNEAKIR
jgi:hypothetical protein